MIEFREACICPKTSHHTKQIVRFGGRTMLADKPALRVAKSFWDTLFLVHRPAAPLDGPLVLLIELTWPWNKGDSKKLRALGLIVHDRGLDLDNAAKTLTDAMGRCGFFVNDSRIVDLRLRKYRGDSPGVYVRLESGGIGE